MHDQVALDFDHRRQRPQLPQQLRPISSAASWRRLQPKGSLGSQLGLGLVWMGATLLTTRSGKAYSAYSCPATFLLAQAIQEAIEEERDDAQRNGILPESQPRDFAKQEHSPYPLSPQTNSAHPNDLEGASLQRTSIPPLNASRVSAPTIVSQGDANGIHQRLQAPFHAPSSADVFAATPSHPLKRKAASDEPDEARTARRTNAERAPRVETASSTSSNHRGAAPSIAECEKISDGSENDSSNEGVANGWREKAKERRKRHKRESKRRRKQKAFNENAQKHRPEDISARLSSSSTIPTKVDIEGLPSNIGGYEARREFSSSKGDAPKLLNLEELKAQGFTEIEWDGKEPLLIIHPETKKLLAIGVGVPEDETYGLAVKAVHELFLRLGLAEEWEEKYWKHKRGEDWVAVNMGTAYGFGNEPYNQRNEGHEQVVQELRESPHLRRLAVHQSESLKFYIPRLYEYYHQRTLPFRQKHPHLTSNWENSIFCSAACNLGPKVATFWHRDCMNLPFGFCAVHSLGNYDHTKGGHLALKELKLIVQFPPGALILLPSAVITHGNIPVCTGETRTSFTQYTAGAVFRYVDNGFRSEAKFKKQDKKAYMKMLDEKPKKWKAGLGLWSTVDELVGSG